VRVDTTPVEPAKSTAKKARKKKAPAPLTLIDGTGEVHQFFTPEQNFEHLLKENEDQVVQSLKDLLAGDDENAACTAATKIFEFLEDDKTHAALREKLGAIRESALDCLLRLSNGASKATAQAQANARLLKVMVAKAPAVWPPDTSKPEWKQRFARALELAAT
jgi:hypothetical protein